MTNSGWMLSRASIAAPALLKGWTSCPSERRSSETIWSIVISSSTRSTLAMRRTVKAFPRGSKSVQHAPPERSPFAGRIDDLAHLEDGQEHTNNDAADNDAQEDNQQGLDQGSKTGEG